MPNTSLTKKSYCKIALVFVATIIFLLPLVSVCAVSSDENMLLVGDVNSDGLADITDLALLKKLLAGIITDTSLLNGDVNDDGAVDTTDLGVLKIKLAGADLLPQIVYVVEATGTDVNVRADVGTSFAVIGQINPGTKYDYVGEANDTNGTLWYHIKDSILDGWVTSQFSVKRDVTLPDLPVTVVPDIKDGAWLTAENKVYYLIDGVPVKGWADIGGFRYRFDSITGEKMTSVGIDVSEHQRDIDWAAVKNSGVEYAFIRVAYRGYETGKMVLDKTFAQNIIGAQKVGIKCGVYFYSVAVDQAESIAEAQFLLEAIKGYSLELPVVIDEEHSTDRVSGLTAKERTDNAIAFMETVKNAGQSTAIYTGHYYYLHNLERDRLMGYPLWLAHYTDNYKDVADVDYQYWQYASDGTVAGITGRVDINVVNSH